MKTLGGWVVCACLVPAASWAHVGSPDIVHEGKAGPYTLLVSITPPQVIPGVARVEVEAEDADLSRLTLVPMPLSGDGARFPPTSDIAEPIPGAPRHFSAQLWLMSSGSWQVRLDAEGPQGKGELAVPVPALPAYTKGMGRGLGVALAALLLLLAVGGVSIAAAATGEALLEPGQEVDARRARWGRVVRVATAAVIALAGWGANAWWNDEAAAYRRHVYKPLGMTAVVAGGGLELTLVDSGGMRSRRLDDLVPDHDHLMHLYLLRVPELDRVWHLHPELAAEATFRHPLPPDLPAGHYQLFADVVHATGLAETTVAQLDLPASVGAVLLPDDAAGAGPGLSTADPSRREAALREGRMVWLHDGAPLRAGPVEWLRFRVDEANGQPSSDLEPYMGMAGHAAIVRDDRTVFAHIHPSGSVPMAALAVAGGGADPHAGHQMAGALPAQVSFPFRFPREGRYRLIVQVKRRGVIETAMFDAQVSGT